MSPTVQRRTVAIVDVTTGQGPTLRLSLESDEAGEPLSLKLTLGWDAGSNWRPHDTHREIELPAAILPNVSEALDALKGA